MATKRPGGEIGGAPPAKKPSLAMAPLDIGPAAGEDDLDIKVLKVSFYGSYLCYGLHVRFLTGTEQ